MAADTLLSSYADYVVFFGTTPPGTEAQYTAIITALSKAIRKKLSSNITQCEYSVILNAPPSECLLLPQGPVSTGLTVWANSIANTRGNLNAFTDDDLLVEFTDYYLDVDSTCPDLSTSRILYRVGGAWGASSTRYPGQLGADLRSAPAAVRVDFTAGYEDVPSDIALAVNLAVSKVYQMRERGGMMSSESRGGYSYQLGQEAMKVLQDPDIWDLLSHYQSATAIIG